MKQREEKRFSEQGGGALLRRASSFKEKVEEHEGREKGMLDGDRGEGMERGVIEVEPPKGSSQRK